MIKKRFNELLVNTINTDKEKYVEVVFSNKGKWYSIPFDAMPDHFKELYVFKLKLEGHKIPDNLRKYDKTQISTNVYVEFDESKAVDVTETYPL